MESLTATEKLEPHPRNRSSIRGVIAYLSFTWVLPTLLKGRNKKLEIEDLYQPLSDHHSQTLGDRLEKSWQNEVQLKKSNKKPPNLMRAGLKTFGSSILLRGILLLIFELSFRVTVPLLLGQIIRYYAAPEEKDRSDAFLYAAGIILCNFFSVLSNHLIMLSNLGLGMKLRIAACSMIYRKALKLGKNALIDTSSGQIVNLLSNDVSRFDLIVVFFHYLWVGPVQMGVVTFLMYQEIGISAIAGMMFLLAFIPFQFYLGKKTSSLRLKTALRTDERVRLMNEIIQGIQVIKMYAWEKPFSKVVALLRGNEIRVIRYVSWIRGILVSFVIFSSRTSIFLSLVLFVILGNSMTSYQAFVITAYYNVVRVTMLVFFPTSVGLLAETRVSVKRLEKFMLSEELDREFQNGELNSKDDNVNVKEQFTAQQSKITLTNVCAKWNNESVESNLKNINLNLEKSEVIAVIGKVGAGKSTLLQAILGEIPIESGDMKINGRISYASQEPWIFASSIRKNILFGEKMDKNRYESVVRVCALKRDFELFPHGDKTMVGERGTNLSGGQKARIGLARAIYRKADIYLLDDPLSAVDTHVGRHLFDLCIKGFLKDQLVILVTHQLQYLQEIDQIIILNNGFIEEIGSYENIKKSGLDLANLFQQEIKENEGSEDQKFQKKELNRSTSLQSRKMSSSTVSSQASDGNDSYEEQEAFEEKRSEGSIGLKYYKSYFKAGGGYFPLFIVGIFFLLAQLSASGGDYYLSYWVSKEESKAATTDYRDKINETATIANDTISFMQEFLIFFSENENRNNIDIYIFTAITLATIFFTLTRSFLFFNQAMASSKTLHDAMFSGCSKASMFFFNTNPSGRILNRFSKDIGQIDEILPMVMIDVVQIFLSLVGIITVVATVNPLFLIPTFIIAVIFYYLRSFYLKTSRDLKRLEATTRSPVFTHLSETLNGLPTIRALNAEKMLAVEFDNHQDLNSSAYYMFVSAARAFGFWLDFTLVIYVTIVVLSFFVMKDTGGNVGLAITQAMSLTGMLQWGMRQSAELENVMTSVERVVEYKDIDSEPAFESATDKKPPKEWPLHGEIKFVNLSLSYFPDMNEMVLKNLEFTIKSCEKVGIIGRTGAGKSSIINALFRLSYLDGHIFIDNRDVIEMGLHELRSKISIIPQNPVLFSASMRYNLDPFDEFSDEKIWQALEGVKLKHLIGELPAGLSSKVAEGGSNFSIGEKQLVCLARAMLRENKIILMDEATSNVDLETDNLIQSTIRENFANCTVVTIAHRLSTVIDYDKILVMDAGKCVEFATPYELLKEDKGYFYNMVKQTGDASFQNFRLIAENKFKQAHGWMDSKNKKDI